jgi:capsular exopolysaccharide synthesis family protein
MDGYGAPPASSQGLRRFVVFLRRYWWIPLITLLLTGGTSIALIVLAPPVFVSTATMWETEKLHLSEGALFTDDSQTYIGTQMELLKSGRLWQLAIDRLKAAGTNSVPLGKDGLPLAVSLNFREAPKSAVFSITASSTDPAFSRNFLDALMSEYLEYKKNVRKLVSGDTAASISAQVETREAELKAAHDALTLFQRTNNLAILQEEGSMAGGYLEKLQIQISDLQLESQLLQATAVEQKTSVRGNSSGAQIPVGLMKNLDSTGLPAAGNEQLTPYQELQLLNIQREKLSKYLRPKHPKIVALDEQIARSEKLLDLFRNQNHDQLVAYQEAIKMKMDSVLASIKDWEAKVTDANARIAEAESLKLSVTRAQSMYDRLANLLQSVDISRNTDLETLSILEPASPARRSYQQISQNVTMAILGGLGLGLGIIFLIQMRDDRFTSVIDVNSTLGDAIVGLLPEVPREKGKEPMRLLELDDPRHAYAESYRSLRSALLFLPTEGERPKVLLITSAMPNEGKSTVAANLARTLALSGSRVLLVDGDLRKGHLHHLLHMQSGPGLTELLHHTCDADKIIQRDPLSNFAFIPCGTRSGNPGDLFLGSGLDEILAKWRREFDFVIIDSSPVFAADDASCLAPKVDGTLFVVRRGHSSARAVSEALDLLAQRQARVLGVVFNGVDATSRNYHYYKYADYNPSAKTA